MGVNRKGNVYDSIFGNMMWYLHSTDFSTFEGK